MAAGAGEGGLHFRSLPNGLLDPGLGCAAIVQQVNCVSTHCGGLARRIAVNLPYACPYSLRRPNEAEVHIAIAEDMARPGTIALHHPTVGYTGPIVINFFAQWYSRGPSRSSGWKPPNGLEDSREQREAWFQECLEALSCCAEIPSPVAFPKRIGCGLAKGNWGAYERLLVDFARHHPTVDVVVVDLSRNA